MLPRNPLGLEEVVQNGLCIGCGLCQSVAGVDTIRLEMTDDGGERPVLLRGLEREVEARIMAVCPGTKVEAPGRLPASLGAQHDVMWGNALRIVEAHATDPQVRSRGPRVASCPRSVCICCRRSRSTLSCTSPPRGSTPSDRLGTSASIALR